MVNTFALSVAFVGASLATLAQGAALKQDPLFGCVPQYSGTLGLANSEEGPFTPANFIAGLTTKSNVSKETKLSQLATKKRTGADVEAGSFEFLNCTQSLIDRGYKLVVPKNFQDLTIPDDEETGEVGITYTYSFGVLRNTASKLHSLSAQSLPSAAGSIDAVPLVHSKYAKTDIKARTFVLATSNDGESSFLQLYAFNGDKSTNVYQADKKFGLVELTSKPKTHPGSTFLALAGTLPELD